jgi:hypothetical protein
MSFVFHCVARRPSWFLARRSGGSFEGPHNTRRRRPRTSLRQRHGDTRRFPIRVRDEHDRPDHGRSEGHGFGQRRASRVAPPGRSEVHRAVRALHPRPRRIGGTGGGYHPAPSIPQPTAARPGPGSVDPYGPSRGKWRHFLYQSGRWLLGHDGQLRGGLQHEDGRGSAFRHPEPSARMATHSFPRRTMGSRRSPRKV